MGRVNTQNRDGGEIRVSKFINWLSNRASIEVFCPKRQLSVLANQDVNLSRLNVNIVPDLLQSEADSLCNVLFTYAFRLVALLFKKYPKDIGLIYSPSDFLFDVLPSILCKLRNKDASLCICVFLICPNPFYSFKNPAISIKGLPSIRQILYYLSQLISLKLAKFFDAKLFVLNKIDEEFLAQKNYSVKVLTMGVDIAEFDNVVPPPIKYDAIYFGRLHQQKGLERLLKAWAIVCRSNPLNLCIIGGGSESYKNRLSSLASTLGISHYVDFVGFKSGTEKISLIKSSKVAVIPSTYESFGMTIIEAGLCGLPVIAFDIPVFKELFGGFIELVPNDDIDYYAKQILISINEPRFNNDKFINFCKSLDWEVVFCKDMEFINE